MSWFEEMSQRSLVDDNKTCRVCGDVANGLYFGAVVCLPCKVRKTMIYVFLFNDTWSQ